MGLFSSSNDAFQFRPDTSQMEGDVQSIRNLRDRPIGGLTDGGKAELGLMDLDRNKALDNLKAAQAGRLATQQSQMALSGGLSSGASERLSRSSADQGGLFSQGLQGDFAREGAGIRARNIGQQESLRNQAMFAMPGLSQGIFQQQAGIDAANAQSQQAASSGRNQMMSGIGGILGSAAGTAFGGPIGGALGGALGGGLFSSIF